MKLKQFTIFLKYIISLDYGNYIFQENVDFEFGINHKQSKRLLEIFSDMGVVERVHKPFCFSCQKESDYLKYDDKDIAELEEIICNDCSSTIKKTNCVVYYKKKF